MTFLRPGTSSAQAASAKSNRKNACLAEAAFAAAVLLIALAGYLLASAGQADAEGGHAVAVVSRDGAVVDEIDLDAVEAPYELRFDDNRGLNVAQVEPGRIRIVDADCPDKVCAHEGWIDRPGAPIACVPHSLTITIENRIANGTGGADGVDATTR